MDTGVWQWVTKLLSYIQNCETGSENLYNPETNHCSPNSCMQADIHVAIGSYCINPVPTQLDSISASCFSRSNNIVGSCAAIKHCR